MIQCTQTKHKFRMTLWVYWCVTVFRQTETYHQLQFLLFPPSPSHTTWDSLEYVLGVFTCLQAEHLHHNFMLPGAKFYSFISSCSSSYLSISFVCIHTAYGILHLIKSECNIKTTALVTALLSHCPFMAAHLSLCSWLTRVNCGVCANPH